MNVLAKIYEAKPGILKGATFFGILLRNTIHILELQKGQAAPQKEVKTILSPTIVKQTYIRSHMKLFTDTVGQIEILRDI